MSDTPETDSAKAMEEMMGPRRDVEGIFRYHNCWRCNSGEKPCANGNPHNCEFPHARDD